MTGGAFANRSPEKIRRNREGGQAWIDGNLIRGTRDGIWACNSTVTVTRNELVNILASGVITDGIRIQGCYASLVTENTIREAYGANCLRLMETNVTKVFDNVVNRCSVNGIVVDAASFALYEPRQPDVDPADVGAELLGRRRELRDL